MCLAASFFVVKSSKLAKCSLTIEWIKKSWCVLTVECYSAIKCEDLFILASTFAEENKLDKKEYMLLNSMYINSKIQTYF